MSNSKVKIIYSLKLHIALLEHGFKAITEMRNPNKPEYNCWVYEDTDAFREAFDELAHE